jgi:hypothetical protein
MPKLLVFAPCERVIYERDDNGASLITLLEGLTVTSDEKLAEDAIMPIRWQIFTSWKIEEGEQGKDFEQRIVIIAPSGKQSEDNIATFHLQREYHHIRTQIIGLPIGIAGVCLIKLSLREQGQEAWQELAEYPIIITYAEAQKSDEKLIANESAES